MDDMGEMRCVVWMFGANMFAFMLTVTMIGLKLGGII